MSGLEALGGIAAVTQIFAYLLQALFEVRDQIKNASGRVQAYAQRLESLRRTVQYIQDHPIFVTNVVEALLKTISEQVDRIRNILHKSFSREPRSLARRLIRLHVERMAEQQIRESLANLESYKSDLMICISSTMERSTTGMLLEDGGISLEAHAVTRDLSVTRKIVPVPKHGDSSQCQALIASGQRSDELISTLSIEDEETTNSTSSVESDETLNSNPFTQRGEPGNSNRVDNSPRSEWQDPNFANNIVDNNGFGIMGNYGNVARQQSSKFSNNSMRKNKVALMGNMDYQALSMLLNAKGTLEALKVQVDN